MRVEKCSEPPPLKYMDSWAVFQLTPARYALNLGLRAVGSRGLEPNISLKRLSISHVVE